MFAERGATVVGVDLAPARRGSWRSRPTSPTRSRSARSTRGSRRARADRRPLQQRRHQPQRRPARSLETDLDAWQRVQDVNVRSVFLCCKHGIPHLLDGRRRLGDQHRLVRRRDGRRGLADLLHRVEGRGAGDVARARGRVRRPRRARQRALPRSVNTPLLQELFAKDPEKAARRLVHLPMGRFGEPEEIAARGLFLASDESSFVTASTFLVDGGLSGAYLTPVQRARRPQFAAAAAGLSHRTAAAATRRSPRRQASTSSRTSSPPPP